MGMHDRPPTRGNTFVVSYDYMIEDGPPISSDWLTSGQFHSGLSASPPCEVMFHGNDCMGISANSGSSANERWGTASQATANTARPLVQDALQRRTEPQWRGGDVVARRRTRLRLSRPGRLYRPGRDLFQDGGLSQAARPGQDSRGAFQTSRWFRASSFQAPQRIGWWRRSA